jgi:glycosyltransferase involved in cell wall biosynthesis
MLRILFVEYHFPPASIGVRRIVSLLRHLDPARFEASVLTVRETAGEGCDPGPLEELAARRILVIRTGSLDPYRLLRKWRGADDGTPQPGKAARPGDESLKAALQWMRRFLLVPDDRIGWLPFAIARGLPLARRADVLYSSNYPQTTHLVAGLLAMLAGKPWVADFRDGWTQNPMFYLPGTRLHAAMQRGLEAWCARRATRVVTVSPPITAHLQSLRTPGTAPVETIYNGFEEGMEPEDGEGSRAPLTQGRRTLLYTGTFFGPRRPDLFLEALAAALRQRPDLRGRWRVRLRAQLDGRAMALIGDLGLADVVEVASMIPHRDAIAEQRRADGLLLILEHGPGGDIMVSQKVFEYLAARRPVLALIPSGACEQLLAETGGAVVSTSRAARDVAIRIIEFFDAIDDGTRSLADASVLARFSRRAHAARFMEIFSEIAAHR